MIVCVLDTSAVIAYFMLETGWENVKKYLDAGDCLMHAVNSCEALYEMRRKTTPEDAQRRLMVLEAAGVTRREDLDFPFLQIVADYKNAPGATALGDCFGLALAQREGLPFVTSDRGELTRVQQRGTVAIDFIR